MRIITIDFETFYDKEFSLSKITTEEYVRDDRFETIGFSYQIDNGPIRWITGDDEYIANSLKALPWKDSFALAHNALFDASILSWRYDLRPMAWLDTLSMARAIHGSEVGNSLAKLVDFYKLGQKGTEVVAAMGKRRRDFTDDSLREYGSYCSNDVDLTARLFADLVHNFKQPELKLIDLTIRMFSDPVLRLDTPMLEAHLEEVRDRKERLMAAVATDRESLMSNQKFAELLIRCGVEPPTKMSLATGKETLAMAKSDEEFKALLEHPDERVQALVAARLGNKSTLEETRTERFIAISKRGAMPVPLQYYAAHTGRWGGTDKINLQNLPSRGANAGKLKKAILAPRGYVIIDSDSSQIEARVLAWWAGQSDLVEAFRRKEDVYKLTASAIYAKKSEEITEEERFVGKTTILGSGYGMGAPKFKIQLKTFNTEVSESEARHIIDTYRMTYPLIPKLWTQGNVVLDAILSNQTADFGNGCVQVHGMDGILMPNGLYQRYPNLRKVVGDNGRDQFVYDAKRGVIKIYGAKLVENVCQGLARCIIGEQMVKISKKYRVVLTVHDAIACIARTDEAHEAMEYVQECMRWVPDWAQGLPLNCEAGYGDNYGEC